MPELIDGPHCGGEERSAERDITIVAAEDEEGSSPREAQMEQRIDYVKVAPEGYAAMLGIERYIYHCGLEPSPLELIKLRASQINGCAFCVDMHTKDARAAGESV
jgi:AhpD family alkylhydroperoxidase